MGTWFTAKNSNSLSFLSYYKMLIHAVMLFWNMPKSGFRIFQILSIWIFESQWNSRQIENTWILDLRKTSPKIVWSTPNSKFCHFKNKNSSNSRWLNFFLKKITTKILLRALNSKLFINKTREIWKSTPNSKYLNFYLKIKDAKFPIRNCEFKKNAPNFEKA